MPHSIYPFGLPLYVLTSVKESPSSLLIFTLFQPIHFTIHYFTIHFTTSTPLGFVRFLALDGLIAEKVSISVACSSTPPSFTSTFFLSP